MERLTAADLSRDLTAQAATDPANRASLLCAVIAIRTTSSLAAARKVLREWDTTSPAKAGAIDIIDAIEGTV